MVISNGGFHSFRSTAYGFTNSIHYFVIWFILTIFTMKLTKIMKLQNGSFASNENYIIRESLEEIWQRIIKVDPDSIFHSSSPLFCLQGLWGIFNHTLYSFRGFRTGESASFWADCLFWAFALFSFHFKIPLKIRSNACLFLQFDFVSSLLSIIKSIGYCIAVTNVPFCWSVSRPSLLYKWVRKSIKD